jgi:hypothetical protein
MPMRYAQVDRSLADDVILRFVGGGKVAFQFPPRITSDSRKGNWEERDSQGTEPIAVFRTSGPREISLSWMYIVADSGSGSGWSTTKIAEEVRRVRGYFARVRQPGNDRNLVVKFKMWKLGGDDEMSCRIRSIDVKHSDTIVVPCGDNGPQVQLAYPLRTDITVDLRIWTQGGPKATQELEGLLPDETPDWY